MKGKIKETLTKIISLLNAPIKVRDITCTYTAGTLYYAIPLPAISGYKPIGVLGWWAGEAYTATNDMFDAYVNYTTNKLHISCSTPSTGTSASISVLYIRTELWGGVLRSPVVSRLCAILKIGGGVNEGNVRKTAYKGTDKTADTFDTVLSHTANASRSIRILCEQVRFRLANRSDNSRLNRRTNTIQWLCNWKCLRHKRHADLCGALQSLHNGIKCAYFNPRAVRNLTLSERGWAV